MSYGHPHGKVENILRLSTDKNVEIFYEPMKNMFLHPDVKNRKIIAFSIFGARRKGKSFFLDYCLRFLYAHYPSINYPNNPVANPAGWIGEENEPLRGFSWRSGAVRDTTGIFMWNDVFLHTFETTGEKVAIFVMDMQGLFDDETSPMDNSRIFALGTLISSIQVLNLSGVVQDDQLQYLQFATEFAKFAANDSQGTSGKPFQKLLFLIRDWMNPDEYPFGIEGGVDYLKYFLKIKSDQKEELKSVRQFIYSSFEELSCSLLPHPGRVVANLRRKSKKYDGNWGEMDEDFKDELVHLIEYLFKPENLTIKKIHGNELIGAEFFEYAEYFFDLFQSNQISNIQAIYESTKTKEIKISRNFRINRNLRNYKKSIRDVFQHIVLLHESTKDQAKLIYMGISSIEISEAHQTLLNNLLNQTEKIYRDWKNQAETCAKTIEESLELVNKLYF